MPRVSILSFSKNEDGFESLKLHLRHQTFKDFEFIGEIFDQYPDSWLRAIQKARGEIIVFLEPGSIPVNNDWLEELISEVVDEKTIVKGLEITSSPLDPSNLAGFRQSVVNELFNENYLWAEDTEFFCRLNEHGFRIKHLNSAPVVHLSKLGSKTYVRRAFRYGLYRSRLFHQFLKPVELSDPRLACKQIIGVVLTSVGIVAGYLFSYLEKH
jgi:hypothetical protein